MSRPIILDVGGGSGEWSRPYRLAGYDVRVIDPTVWPFLTAEDAGDRPFSEVHGLLLAPPCTEFAGSGARWWADKPDRLLEEAVAVVRAFHSLVALYRPAWWALENPVGRLARCVPELGAYRYSFQPWNYGDPETKRTCMWGEHVRPPATVTTKPDVITARVHMNGTRTAPAVPPQHHAPGLCTGLLREQPVTALSTPNRFPSSESGR